MINKTKGGTKLLRLLENSDLQSFLTRYVGHFNKNYCCDDKWQQGKFLASNNQDLSYLELYIYKLFFA